MHPVIKSLLLSAYPKPARIRGLGNGSVVLLPRKIEGAARLSIGNDTIVQQNAWIAAYTSWGTQSFDPSIEIGDHVRVGRGVIITAIDRVRIGDGCLFSENVFVSDHTHEANPGLTPPTRQPLASRGPVVIGKHCFIGIRACILSGVELGDYCVVGANAVVTRSFPAGSVLAGAPARLIRTNKTETKDE